MRDQSFISAATRARIRGLAVPIATALGRLGLTPNALTVIGFAGTCVAALAAAQQAWFLAGVLVIVFGAFDLLDGALARATGRVSKFGGFLDSTLDRTGESLVLSGVAIGCAAARFTEAVALAVLALTFASGVTYTRAKAESLGFRAEVGIAPRPERLVILAGSLIVAGVAGGIQLVDGQAMVLGGGPYLVGGLAVIATSSAFTVIQRIWHVRAQAR